MPKIVSDVIDTYVFRKVNARTQFLVLRRRTDHPGGDIWQAIHSRIEPGERAIDAARRDITAQTGLAPDRFYTADYISQFFDFERDAIVLAPALAAQVNPKARVAVSHVYSDYAWCDLEETTARLVWSAHRWAVRHIYDVIAMGGEESDMYIIE
jgi:dATP pyrophosphohydrolase